ncbi:FIST N-terminal domain-containing protein [Desulfatiferula olefinivorans]
MPIITAATGISVQSDAYLAGSEATAAAVASIGQRPDALLVFASSHYDHQALLSGIDRVTGFVPMAGGTTAGELSDRGFSQNSVVVLAVCSRVLRFTTAAAGHMRRDEYACARRFTDRVLRQCRDDKPLSLIVFPDGLGGDGDRVIAGIQAGISGPIDIVGGFLGDGDRFLQTIQFHDGKVLEDAVTGLMISAPAGPDVRTGVGVGSGFLSIGNSMLCTRSGGMEIFEIDHEPALDLYMELLGEVRYKRLPEVCLEYPFGLIDRPPGQGAPLQALLRCGLRVDYEKRSITLAGSVPEGRSMSLFTCSRGDLTAAARKAAQRALAMLDGRKPELVIAFSCVGRKIVLGRRVNEEFDAVREVFGPGVPVTGFYTYGEIGPVDASADVPLTGFHNETMVVWALGGNG